MRRAVLAAAATVVAGCGASVNLPPDPAPIVIASAPPLPPPGTPAPLLVVPGAEASPRVVIERARPEPPRLRSEGKRHAIQRTSDGVVVISAERGVIGFLPGAIKWAGFVENDEVLVLDEHGNLRRAASPEDAIAGKLVPAAPPAPGPRDDRLGIDPLATLWASAGKIVVGVAPREGSVFHLSRDAGRTFTNWKLPAPGPIADLTVRSDGVVVALVEKSRRNHPSLAELTAVAWSAPAGGNWREGPTGFARHGSSPLTHHGDTIALQVLKAGSPGDTETRGLDARGRWIDAPSPQPWLGQVWTSGYFDLAPPVKRPGYPGKDKEDDYGGLGLLGGLAGKAVGVSCLSGRPFGGEAPRLQAFSDGECAAEHVIEKTETYDVFSPDRGSRKEQYKHRVCDPAAPARRASTLLLPGGARLGRLPLSCVSGVIGGTERATFVHCDGKHRGRAGLFLADAEGALSEVSAPAPPPDPEFHFDGAESASDGTTVMRAGGRMLLCRPRDRVCEAIGGADLLTARPLPGGRALVARRGADDHELVLDLMGQPGSRAVRAAVPGNLLFLEVTAAGHVRLWTHAEHRHLPRDHFLRDLAESGCEPLLVRVDGVVERDAGPR